jgi:hypothetical protein
MQSIGSSDFLQIQGFGFATFRDDQNAGVRGTPRFFGRFAAQLPVFGLIVAPH